MTYQPTDAQVEAGARELYRTIAAHQGEMHDTWDQEPPEAHDAHREFAKRTLIAAHEAAEPVDTTEFEATIDNLIDWTLDYDEATGNFYDAHHAARQHLIDLYVRAATR